MRNLQSRPVVALRPADLPERSMRARGEGDGLGAQASSRRARATERSVGTDLTAARLPRALPRDAERVPRRTRQRKPQLGRCLRSSRELRLVQLALEPRRQGHHRRRRLARAVSVRAEQPAAAPQQHVPAVLASLIHAGKATSRTGGDATNQWSNGVSTEIHCVYGGGGPCRPHRRLTPQSGFPRPMVSGRNESRVLSTRGDRLLRQ